MDKKSAIVKAALGRGSDLETILAAWDSATAQLEHTHEALCEEVDRLSSELEAKSEGLACHGRQAELGQMASRVAGEVRNNLMPVALNLSLLRRRVTGDPIALNILGKIEAGVTTVEATVSDLAQFVGDRAVRWCTFSLAKLIDEILTPLGSQLTGQTIDVLIDVPQEQAVRADRNMTRQAILNLVLNALEAMLDGGTLTITSAMTPRGLEVEVADTGPGLSEDSRDRVFEPFFTTKSSAAGLGLAVVHRSAEAHGGCVTAMNCPDGGAAFTLCLPQERAMKAAA